MSTSKPRFFRAASAFGDWLAKHHDSESELLVGFYKKDSGRASVTYAEALDEVLAIGWIDGVRRSIDAERYSIRFSPRQPRSVWSTVNIARVGELTAAGRMKAEGLAAFERRDAKRSGVYSYERDRAEFSPDEVELLQADRKAFAFFESQAPYYKRVATFWVVTPKKPETRVRRMTALIECSRKGERIGPLAQSARR